VQETTGGYSQGARRGQVTTLFFFLIRRMILSFLLLQLASPGKRLYPTDFRSVEAWWKICQPNSNAFRASRALWPPSLASFPQIQFASSRLLFAEGSPKQGVAHVVSSGRRTWWVAVTMCKTLAAADDPSCFLFSFFACFRVFLLLFFG